MENFRISDRTMSLLIKTTSKTRETSPKTSRQSRNRSTNSTNNDEEEEDVMMTDEYLIIGDHPGFSNHAVEDVMFCSLTKGLNIGLSSAGERFSGSIYGLTVHPLI